MDKKDTIEDKNMRIATILANMELGEKISPTNLAKKCNIHPDTLRKFFDALDTFKEINYETVRGDFKGKENFIRFIMRTENNLDIKKAIIDLRKDVLDVKSIAEELKAVIQKKKKR